MSVKDSRIAYVTVEHEYYGCETGCCGWVAYAYDANNNLLHTSSFNFMESFGYGEGNNEESAREFADSCFPGAPLNVKESDWNCPLD